MHTRRDALVIIVLLSLVLAPSAGGVTRYWEAGDDDFTDRFNWSDNDTPGEDDTGKIWNGGTAIVRWADGINVGRLYLGFGSEGYCVGYMEQNEVPLDCTIGVLYIGNATIGTGAYTLSVGTVTIGQALIRETGAFHQSNGHLICGSSGNLQVRGGYQFSGVGTIEMLGTRALCVGGANSQPEFYQSDGLVQAYSIVVGYQEGVQGAYYMAGGSVACTGGLYVGDEGTGTFTQRGGTISSSDIRIGRSAVGLYTLFTDSDTICSCSQLVIGDTWAGTFWQAGGKVIVNGEGGAVIGNSGGSTQGLYDLLAGEFQGTCLTIAASSPAAGTLRVSADALFSVSGDLSLGDGDPRIEVVLALLTDYTELSCDSATLGSGGTLDVSCYRPHRYEDFLIIPATSGATGGFASITSNLTLGLHGAPAFSGTASASGYSIGFQGYTGGDANGDDLVDVGDLGIVAFNWGQSGKTWAQGDFTGDTVVDVGDMGILAFNWGWSGSDDDGLGGIPELVDQDEDGDFDIDDARILLGQED